MTTPDTAEPTVDYPAQDGPMDDTKEDFTPSSRNDTNKCRKREDTDDEVSSHDYGANDDIEANGDDAILPRCDDVNDSTWTMENSNGNLLLNFINITSLATS